MCKIRFHSSFKSQDKKEAIFLDQFFELQNLALIHISIEFLVCISLRGRKEVCESEVEPPTQVSCFMLLYFSIEHNKKLNWAYCVCKSKVFCICRLSLSSSSPLLFRNMEEFGAKTYFTEHRTVDTIQLFVALVCSFCEQVAVKENS